MDGDLRSPGTLVGVQALAALQLVYGIDVVCVVHDEVQHEVPMKRKRPLTYGGLRYSHRVVQCGQRFVDW